MIVCILLLVVGAAMVLWGADRLTDSACAVARRFGISEMVIGMTIVALGTSLPEFVIGMSAVVMGSSDISVGNIVGSNLFNVLVIVGASAIVSPIVVGRNTITKDIPFALLAGVVLILVCADGLISVTDGLILLCFFAVFMWYSFSIAGQGSSHASGNAAGDIQEKTVATPMWRSCLFGIIGIVSLVWGGDIFVDAATEIALKLGVSEMVVGLTIVAAGTSLPELATSVVAARKGASALAIGNVIGSNLFNVFLIMGLSSSIMPMMVDSLSGIDCMMLVLSVLMMWTFATTDRRVVRWEGCVMLATYIIYTVYLIW